MILLTVGLLLFKVFNPMTTYTQLFSNLTTQQSLNRLKLQFWHPKTSFPWILFCSNSTCCTGLSVFLACSSWSVSTLSFSLDKSLVTQSSYLVSLEEWHHFIRLCQVRWHSHPDICIGWWIITHIPSSNAICRHHGVVVCWWVQHIHSCRTATSRRWCYTVCVSIYVCSTWTDHSIIYRVCTWVAEVRIVEWRWDLGLIDCTAGDDRSNIESWAWKYFNVPLPHVLSVQVIGGCFCTFWGY